MRAARRAPRKSFSMTRHFIAWLEDGNYVIFMPFDINVDIHMGGRAPLDARLANLVFFDNRTLDCFA